MDAWREVGWEAGALSSSPSSAVAFLGALGRALSLTDPIIWQPGEDKLPRAWQWSSLWPLCWEGQCRPRQWSPGPQWGNGEGRTCSLWETEVLLGESGSHGRLKTVTQPRAYKLQKLSCFASQRNRGTGITRRCISAPWKKEWGKSLEA